ncbi:MAG: hypothetical protein RLZZ328_1372 [Bacteroidota bacterium]|jgi:hypothetical protein
MREKIFISIPAANDPQLFETISRAIDNAKYPDCLTIAFSTQYSDGLFNEYFGVPVENASQLINKKGAKIIHLNMINGFESGVCVTRKKLSSLVTDETYFFSIDAHTSFGINWDDSIINDYKTLKKYFDKPMITGYIGNAIDIGAKHPDRNNFSILNKREICKLFNSKYVLDRYSIFYKSMNLSPIHCELKPIFFKPQKNFRKIIKIDDNKYFTVIQHLTAHNIFVESKWVHEVGWPEYIKFYGEEQDMSIRSYLSGYDMITCNMRYISDIGPVAEQKNKTFLNYNLNTGSHQIAQLLFSGKNSYYDFTHCERKPIDWLIENGLINNNPVTDIKSDEFDWIREL